jgi:hypothetical protein
MAIADAVPQPSYRHLIGLRALQKPAIPGDDFWAAVPSKLDETIRSKCYGVVGFAAISFFFSCTKDIK